MVPYKSTTQEVSFEWSRHIGFVDKLNVRNTLNGLIDKQLQLKKNSKYVVLWIVNTPCIHEYFLKSSAMRFPPSKT